LFLNFKCINVPYSSSMPGWEDQCTVWVSWRTSFDAFRNIVWYISFEYNWIGVGSTELIVWSFHDLIIMVWSAFISYVVVLFILMLITSLWILQIVKQLFRIILFQCVFFIFEWYEGCVFFNYLIYFFISVFSHTFYHFFFIIFTLITLTSELFLMIPPMTLLWILFVIETKYEIILFVGGIIKDTQCQSLLLRLILCEVLRWWVIWFGCGFPNIIFYFIVIILRNLLFFFVSFLNFYVFLVPFVF
jgi:hypothetical protein